MPRVRKDEEGSWVQTNLLLQPTGADLLYGLGSRYFRHEGLEDDELMSHRPDSLPASLSPRKILEIYRDEFRDWGNHGLGTWVDDLRGDERQECAHKWLAELVMEAFPGLEGTL